MEEDAMYRLRRLIFLTLTMVMIAGCGPKMVAVSSGKKVICSECDKTIRSDIKLLQVKEADVAKYSVRETTRVCLSCQAKLEAKRREEERKREQEEARLERQRMETARRAARESIAGTWVCRFGGILGDAIVHLRSDGSGDWVGPTARVKWSPAADGFNATAFWTESGRARQFHFSGQISSNGSRLVVNGWSQWGFGRNENAVFERL